MQSSLRELARKVLGKDIGASEDIRAPEAHVITQATTQPSQATWDPRFRQLKYEPLRIPSSKRELKEEDASAHAELPETLPTKKQRLSDEMNAVDLPAAESTPPRKRQAPAKPKGSAADPPGKPALNLDELIALAAEENAESEIALSITSAKPTQPLPDAAIEDAGDWVVRMDEAGLDVAPAGPEDEEDAYLELKVPGSIAQCLRGYQRVGVRFLLSAYARGCGAILADDMGLGKTIQSIAFISAVLGKSGIPEVDTMLPQLSRLERIPIPEAPDKGTYGATVAGDDTYAPDYSGTGAPVLVVCPLSLLGNWQDELSAWGTFRVAVLHGASREQALLDVMSGRAEVALTTYAMVRQNEMLAEVPWHVVIFDEAHTLKNPHALTSIAADRLPTRLRYGLTGTPMMNDYDELFHLVNLIVPGRLGSSSEFQTRFEEPMKRGMKKNASSEQKEAAQRELSALLKPILLRRNKSLIRDQLPTKRDHVVFFNLAPLQMAVYRRILELPDAKLVLAAKKTCPCGSGDKIHQCEAEHCPGYWRISEEEGGLLYPRYHFCQCGNEFDPLTNKRGCKWHRPMGCWRETTRTCPFCLIMPLITLLRKVASHVDLIKANPADRHANPGKFAWDCQLAQRLLGPDLDAVGGAVQETAHMRQVDTALCGKLTALKALLAEWAADGKGAGGRPHKVLIFSNSVRMLRIIERVAINAGYEYEYMDGSTPQHERQPKVINFNTSSAFLFLTSTPAGGVGLNLTGANKVVLWDPSWSPAMDLQAMDRAFRLGQMRDVSVYRLIAAGTIEEMQYLRQISKQQHTNMVVEGDEGERRTFNAVKPRKGALGGEHGELWGFYNLFKLEAEKVQSVALLGSQVGDESASAGGGTGGGTSAGAGRGQPFKVELIDPEVMAMLEKEEEAAGGPAEPRSDDGDGLGDFLGDDGDVALLRAVGAAGMLRHEKALGPKKREAAAAREVVEVVKGEMNCPEGAALAPLAPQSTKPPQSRLAAGPAATMLECLAAWLHLPVAEAACQLLEMSEPERTKLRKRYAEHAPTGAFRPKEK